MTFNRSDVEAAVRLVEYVNGRAYVSQPITSEVRTELRALLQEYDVDVDALDMTASADNDLCVLYSTSRKDVSKGYAVAQRIVRKYTPNPLLDTRVPPPAPPQAPKRTELNTPDDVRPDAYWAQLMAKIQRDLNARVDQALDDTRQLQDNVAETLIKYAEHLPQVVAQHVAEALDQAKPTILEVIMPESPPVPLGTVHRKTADIIKMLAAGVNVYLHGPAGSGKTTVARQCSEAFGTQFYFAAKVESEYLLLGFKDARGETVRTQFREAYEHGGLFLFDELDGSSPGAVVALNAALANGMCPFPDGTINRHPEFRCIGAGNTKLGGASRQYTGRTQLDAASIDRFAFVEFGYDEALERVLASDKSWCLYVQAARKAVADRGLMHLITPRATLDGCKLLAAGMDRDDVAEAVVWKGLDANTVEQVKREIRVPLHSAMREAA